MKKIIRLLTATALFLFSGAAVFSQQTHVSSPVKTHNYDSDIQRVYGDEWMAINPEAVAALKACFSTRITYKEETLTPNDKYPLLSSFPLMNKYNPLITEIDYSNFNPQTFVPINYNLPFFSDVTQVIRVDGTNFVIVIDPIKTQH